MPDLRNIYVDRNLDVAARIKNFISDARDPYTFNADGVKINIKMAESGRSFEDALFHALICERE